MLADRMKNIKPSGIRRMFNIAQQMKNPINLGLGEPDFDIPEPLKEVGIESIRQGFNKYTPTQGIPELREKIAEVMQRRSIRYEELLVTSGVTGGLAMSIMALVNPGDEVLIPDPYFVAYEFAVLMFGGVPVFVDTYPDFQLREEAIASKITEKSKIILVNSPNNPTGAVYSRGELEMVSRLADQHNLTIISDEIYDQFTYDGVEHVSLGQLTDGVITLNGFSKTWAMTGWRLGWAAGPSDVLNAMTTLQQFTYTCAPSFVQRAGVKALDYDMSEQIEAYERKRNLAYDALKDDFQVTKPRGAFYIFPQAPWGTGESFIEKALEQRVFCVPGNVFSKRQTHLRISFAAPEASLEQGLEVLRSLAHRAP